MDQPSNREDAINRLSSRILAWFSKPANVILFAFLCVLLVLTLYPVFSLFTETVTIHAGREARAAKQTAGDFSFYHFRRLFATGENSYSWIQFYEPFLNTLLVSLASSMIAIAFGGVVAFIVTRTNIKYKKFISGVFTFPYIMPSWTLALFWENFFKNVHVGLKTSNGIMAAVFKVYSTLPSGMETTVKLDVNGTSLTAVVFGNVDFPVDRKVRFSFNEAAVLFDQESGGCIAFGALS